MTSPSSHTPAGKGYRPDIDGLRAIAVGGVLLFHVGATWLPGGFVGVDVFFVISGYLITAIIARESDAGTFTYGDFYERRIRRIYPALIVVLLATLALAWVVMIPLDFRHFGRTLVWTPLFASNFAFMGQTGYFDPDGSMKPLLHTWSLGVEEQFYIVFPLILMGARRFGVDRLRLVIGIAVVSFAASVVTGVVGWGDAYFLLPTRFWELGLGALLALRPMRPASATARSALGVAGLAAIAASMLWIDETMAFPGWVAAVPVAGAGAVLVAETGPAARLLSTAPFTFIGRISYPMYLWHWPLIVFAPMYFFHPLTLEEGAAIVVVTIAAAWATMVIVETPIRSRAVFGGRRGLFAVAGVATVALVVAGVAVFNLKHLNRWTSPAQEALAAVVMEGAAVDEMCPTAQTGIAGEHVDCRIGLVGETAPAPSFAVLGDSHARALGGAISEAGVAAGRAGLYFGRIACPPMVGIDRPGDKRLRCAAHLDASLAEIRASAVDTVFLVTRWAVTVTGHDYGRSPAEVHPILRDGRMVREAERRATVVARLGATLDALAGRRVVIVDSVPEVRFDVPNVLANAQRLGRPQPVGPTRAEFDARQREVRSVLAEVAASRPWVSIVEPARLLCDAAACAITEAGRPLYMDADHLSRLGARRLAPLFAEAMAGGAPR